MVRIWTLYPDNHHSSFTYFKQGKNVCFVEALSAFNEPFMGNTDK